jgi:YegS/Rv2252/BmrU family lipid kinase
MSSGGKGRPDVARPVVAVVAHKRKRLGGGLGELRRLLHEHGIEPRWYEVNKSKKARKRARRAVADGAELVLIWGGDGTVQRCLDGLAGRDVTVALLPAGTANLLATNLGIPTDLRAAVDIGLHGRDRRLDLGVVNGEHFAVMAGAGFDARLIAEADRGLKDRFGRLAYVWTGAKALKSEIARTQIVVDGAPWFDGDASCVLVGNVGTITGGLTAFEQAEVDDGILEIGVVTAASRLAWLRVLASLATKRPERSSMVRLTRGTALDVHFARKFVYQLDGGARPASEDLHVEVEPGAIKVRVPAGGET